jgi:capsular exopolysaccharide synthesis family protein
MTSIQPAAVPSVTSRFRESADTPRAVEQIVSLVAPDSLAADQYRSLRHVIERLRAESALQVLAVSSPAPGDGKTVTTLNLAGALAQSSDARVLVIDADLRRPSVGGYLGLSPRLPGLTEAATDSSLGLSRVMRRFDGFNLSVVPAGQPTNTPYELLNSPVLEALVTDARRHFDYVLVDTPPVVPLPDCRLIERLVDGFLIVVAAHKTPRKTLAEALNTIDARRVVGLVFNADDRPSADYYGYYYRSDSRTSTSWWRRRLGR